MFSLFLAPHFPSLHFTVTHQLVLTCSVVVVVVEECLILTILFRLFGKKTLIAGRGFPRRMNVAFLLDRTSFLLVTGRAELGGIRVFFSFYPVLWNRECVSFFFLFFLSLLCVHLVLPPFSLTLKPDFFFLFCLPAWQEGATCCSTVGLPGCLLCRRNCPPSQSSLRLRVSVISFVFFFPLPISWDSIRRRIRWNQITSNQIPLPTFLLLFSLFFIRTRFLMYLKIILIDSWSLSSQKKKIHLQNYSPLPSHLLKVNNYETIDWVKQAIKNPQGYFDFPPNSFSILVFILKSWSYMFHLIETVKVKATQNISKLPDA